MQPEHRHLCFCGQRMFVRWCKRAGRPDPFELPPVVDNIHQLR